MVFYGEYEVSIAESGRIALPKKIREMLIGGDFVLTRGYGNCLAGYDKRDWETRAKSLLDVSLLDKDQIGKRRLLFSTTVYLTIDEQGRLVIPKNLRNLANLKGKIIIAGVGDHFEIWDESKWLEYLKTVDE